MLRKATASLWFQLGFLTTSIFMLLGLLWG